jgi:O-antigen/teichoic acid export membrane protein
MKTTRLARRIGLDRNPLRRRTDKIAARVTVLLPAMFLIGAPLFSMAAGAAAVGTITLGILLLCLAGAARWMLDRRRLADWEAAWTNVGPEWTKRFRSRGAP